ncbi:MAG: toll/interleukin-1 receptor domain-containing protein [Sphingomonadales bacterium]
MGAIVAGAEQAIKARYRAFISYSHVDLRAVTRLHHRLEAFRLPRHLGNNDEPLNPIFRDLVELPAADSLSDAVNAALTDSAALLVCCSPAAAESRWVNLEITRFRALHPDRPVLAAIMAGTAETALPPALTADGHEPLAADLTGNREAQRLGFLKLVAGLAGLPLDELVQRDAQARLRRVTYITAGALVAMIIMGVLTFTAIAARAEAERQRSEAEGLVEFMLTDLREKLRGVGRLDVMAAASTRALTHYQAQDLTNLPADSLIRRAKALQALGEDEMEARHPQEALALFTEAERTTDALLAAAPDDVQRIFAHAQSEFWLGYLAYSRGDFAGAEPGLVAYGQLARRLQAVAPREVRTMQESVYATGVLCTLRMAQKRAQGLVATCQSALDSAIALSERQPDNDLVTRDLADKYGWMADALLFLGEPEKALQLRLAQQGVIAGVLKKDPQNRQDQRAKIWNQRALARLEADTGQLQAARQRLTTARADLLRALAEDPGNRTLLEAAAGIEKSLREFQKETN